MVEATTDAAGHYRTTLMRAGKHTAWLQHRMVSDIRQAELLDGANTLDFAITGGRIIIELTGWDGAGRLQVNLRGPRGTRGGSWSKANGLTMAYEGLRPGAYTVSIIEPGPRGRTPHVQTVTVGPAGSEARVTFDLSKR
jgi:hypothetical protein